MMIHKTTFAAALAFSLLVGAAIGNGWTTQDALQGTRTALVKQCDKQITKVVGNAITKERRKRIIFLPF